MKHIAFFIVVFCTLTNVAQTEHIIAPVSTFSLCNAPNNNHFCYNTQTVSQKNKLFLFFPGTGGVPYNYRKILKHASNLGYHSIGLCYPNDKAINSFCSSVSDTTCHSKARLEVFDGIDRHDSVTVDTNNCIQKRVLKLLFYLNMNYPTENWGQYYLGNTILWNKIVLSGHSQGGGHAAIISKIKQVNRVVMFASTDWITPLNRNADWITWNGQTPHSAYYGFIHENDESVNFTLEQTTWNKFGMNAFGSIELVDNLSSPYNNSHMLYTQLTPAVDATKFHGSVVSDNYTPMNGSVPAFQDVWTYLLDYPSLTSINEFNETNLLVYPNPTKQSIYINNNFRDTYYTVSNLLGEILSTGVTKNEISFSNFAKGLYYLTIQEEGAQQKTIKLIKD